MKKPQRILLCAVLLAGCVPVDQSTTQLPKSVETAITLDDKKLAENYTQLSDKLWLAKAIKQETSIDLPVYTGEESDTTKIEQVYHRLRTWLGTQAREERVTEDKHEQRYLVKEATRYQFGHTKDGDYLDITAEAARGIRSIFSNLVIDQQQGKLQLTDFNETLSFSREQAVQQVQQLLQTLDYNYTYDYDVAAVSKATLEKYQYYMLEHPDEYEIRDSIQKAQLKDVYYIKAYAKIQDYPLIQQFLGGGSGQINWVHGMTNEYYVTSDGIVDGTLMGVVDVQPTGDTTIQVDYGAAIKAIQSQYDELLLKQNVLIERLNVVYAPLPVADQESQYSRYVFKPLVEVKLTDEGALRTIYLDPTNWKEVK